MGALQNNGDVNGRKKKSRGTTKNASRLKSFARSSTSSGADWGGCSSERLQAVVVAITALGGAVTFGLSRDKGAHSMTLLLDGERQTLWFNGGADLDQELLDATATLEAIE